MDWSINIQSRCKLRRVASEQLCLHWLHELEYEHYTSINHANRREAFLFGRVVAKRLIVEDESLASREINKATQIYISSRDGMGRAVRPTVMIDGRLQPIELSISHSDQSVMAIARRGNQVRLGADIQTISSNPNSQLRLWLTEKERANIGHNDSNAVKTWALKEAVYKAINNGERFQPHQIEVLNEDGRYQCRVRGQELLDTTLSVRQHEDEFVAVAVVKKR
ncbi:MAG: hypothetical protein CMJ78_19770 [Planctomycetaceae bacterium]|nr:hypothetical protein [Planctomycetaceae bacterium]